jgi:hypothetical protein
MPDNRLFIERRPTGGYAGRRANARRASFVGQTQAEAIQLARKRFPGAALHVERVRDTAAGKRDKWRKP